MMVVMMVVVMMVVMVVMMMVGFVDFFSLYVPVYD